jgi:hypothetical protein
MHIEHDMTDDDLFRFASKLEDESFAANEEWPELADRWRVAINASDLNDCEIEAGSFSDDLNTAMISSGWDLAIRHIAQVHGTTTLVVETAIEWGKTIAEVSAIYEAEEGSKNSACPTASDGG